MTLTLEWINEDYYQDEGRIEKRIFKSNFELFIGTVRKTPSFRAGIQGLVLQHQILALYLYFFYKL